MWIQQANVLLGILLAGSVAAQDWPYSCLAATNASEIIDGIDASGKVVVITGGDGNIGKHIAVNMGRTNATTVLACRNATKCQDTITTLEAELALEGKVGIFDTITVDLADFESVRNAATSLMSKYSVVDVLVNNAACYPCNYLSVDGLVVDMQANHYGHALFTNLLLPVLITDAGTSRVVSVASISGFGPFVEQDFRTTLHYDSLQDIVDVWSRNASALSAPMYYAVSKFLIIHYNKELAKRYEGQLVAFATSPGLAREPVTPEEVVECKGGGFLFSPCPMNYEQAATVEVLAALSPGIESFSGAYLDFDTEIYVNAPSPLEWTQDDPSCMPRDLPGWLGTDGTNVMWTDDDRAQWYDIVQDLIGV